MKSNYGKVVFIISICVAVLLIVLSVLYSDDYDVNYIDFSDDYMHSIDFDEIGFNENEIDYFENQESITIASNINDYVSNYNDGISKYGVNHLFEKILLEEGYSIDFQYVSSKNDSLYTSDYDIVHSNGIVSPTYLEIQEEYEASYIVYSKSIILSDIHQLDGNKVGVLKGKSVTEYFNENGASTIEFLVYDTVLELNEAFNNDDVKYIALSNSNLLAGEIDISSLYSIDIGKNLQYKYCVDKDNLLLHSIYYKFVDYLNSKHLWSSIYYSETVDISLITYDASLLSKNNKSINIGVNENSISSYVTNHDVSYGYEYIWIKEFEKRNDIKCNVVKYNSENIESFLNSGKIDFALNNNNIYQTEYRKSTNVFNTVSLYTVSTKHSMEDIYSTNEYNNYNVGSFKDYNVYYNGNEYNESVKLYNTAEELNNAFVYNLDYAVMTTDTYEYLKNYGYEYFKYGNTYNRSNYILFSNTINENLLSAVDSYNSNMNANLIKSDVNNSLPDFSRVSPVIYNIIVITLIMVCLLILALFYIFQQTKVSSDLEKLKESYQLRNRFLSDFSHELRTPLNAVIGFTTILKLQLADQIDEEAHKKFDSILNSSSILLDTINEILDLSKIETGKMIPKKSKFSLYDISREAVNIISSKGHNENVKLILECDDMYKTNRIIGDGFKLRQILINLLSNAYKFTKEGEVKLSVVYEEITRKKFSKENENSRSDVLCTIVVQDTGIGMNEESLERIFQPYVQANLNISEEFGGTGLGLSIVYKLVKLMYGKISAESVVGNGSKFTIVFRFEME